MMMTRVFSRRAVCAAALMIVPAVMAAAFQLQPMSATIELDGSTPTTTFEVSNATDQPVAVQMRTTTREILPDGTELNDDASNELQLFPSQLILRPGQQQTVRVRWTGQGTPERELSYRVVAEQLPINLDRTADSESGVRMMLRYRATLYVRPPGAAADLVVRDLQTDGDTVTLTVENAGTAHRLLADGALVLIADGERTEMRAEEVDPLVTVNVLPGGTRRVSIPLDALPVVPDEISFRFDR